jgi:hypothetical protein
MERQLRMGGGIMNAMPRQQYGLGSFVKKAVKGVTGAVKGVAGAIKDNPALALAALNFAPMLAGAKPFIGMGSLAGSKYTIPGISSIIGGKAGEATLGKTLGVFAGGSLLGGLLGQAEQEGDPEGITRNVGALKLKLADAYRNQRTFADAEDEEAAIAQQVALDTAEYNQDMARGMANGGRIGFNNGSEDYGKLIDAYERGIDVMPGESLTDYINRIRESERKNSAMGGRMQYGLGSLVRGSGVFQPVSASMNAGDTPIMPSSGMGGMLSKLINSNPDIFKKLRSSSSSDFIDENFNGIDDRKEAAYGGRIGYAFGTPEQNAIQASQMEGLPLNQNPAGVTELDLRDSGGFIPPVGVKEKADDIPAMLANNEFVFTADAVRGMGDGNVNKGAQRMYDMMKKLEKGGRV